MVLSLDPVSLAALGGASTTALTAETTRAQGVEAVKQALISDALVWSPNGKYATAQTVPAPNAGPGYAQGDTITPTAAALAAGSPAGTYTAGATFNATEAANWTKFAAVSPSSLAVKVRRRNDVFGGLPVAASGNPMVGGVQPPQNGPVNLRKRHVALAGGSDWRLHFDQPLERDSDGSLQPMQIHAAIEYPAFRRITDLVTNGSGSSTVNSATANFTAADTGRQIIASGGVPAGSYLVYVNATTATLANALGVAVNATGTLSGLSADIGGNIWPVTFGGRLLGTLDTGAFGLISDSTPVEIPAGATFYTRTFATSAFGTYVSLTQANVIGATTLGLSSYPGAATNPAGVTGDIVVGVGAKAEKVTVLSYANTQRTDTATVTSGSSTINDTSILAGDLGRPVTGTGIPASSYVGTVTAGTSFVLVNAAGTAVNATASGTSIVVGAAVTATLSPSTPITIAHAAAELVGGQVVYNHQIFQDAGESSLAGSATDLTLGTSTTLFPALSATGSSTTLAAAATAGSRTIQTVAAPVGTTVNIATDGTNAAETGLTVVNCVGIANPYTVTLSAPLANAHNSASTVTSEGTNAGFGPVVITCDRPTTTPPPIILVGPGDSIPDGTGYNLRNGFSYVTQALEGVRPFVKITKAGETANQFTFPGASRRRKTLIDAASYALYEYGTNDIYSGRTLAQVQADATTIIGWLKQRGLKVTMFTLLPRTTSTDAFATTANQTPSSAASETIRNQYNAWVRSGAGGLADIIWDPCTVIDSGLATGAAETGLWIPAVATIGAYTSDGIHPAYAAAQLLAPAFTTTVVPQLV